MLKKYSIVLVMFISLLSWTRTFADSQITYNKELKNEFNRICSLPGAETLMEKALRKGPIRVEAKYLKDEESQAYWDGMNRTITINSARPQTMGERIHSILFELHNAASDDTLKQVVDEAIAGRLGKEQYVERIERMEHKNAVSCCELYQNGVDQGLFPSDGQVPVLRNFNDHYLMQQITGHSAWIARTYDINCPGNRHPFRGTITQNMPESDRQDVVYYLNMKGDIGGRDPKMQEIAKSALEREYSELKEAIAKHGKKGNLKKRADLMQRVFQRTV